MSLLANPAPSSALQPLRVGIFDSGAIYLNYLTTDCSGTAYITHYSTLSEGTRVGAKLYYPKDQQQLTPRSVRVASADGEGACYAASDIAGMLEMPAATVRSHLRRGLATLKKELEG